MNPRVKEIEYIRPYSIAVTFTNGESKEFDFSRFLNYPIYTPLRDIVFFKKAKIFNGTICWNDEIDFDPDTLYIESKAIEAAR